MQIYVFVTSLLLKNGFDVITVPSSCCSLNAAVVDDLGSRDRKL